MTTEETTYNPIEARRAEVAAYEENILTYSAVLEELPTQWPPHLASYRNRADKHQAAAEIEDLADVDLLSELWYRDQVHDLIRSERVELAKARAILRALEARAK
jgi:hypothetical protein